jgi:hypothetical protein
MIGIAGALCFMIGIAGALCFIVVKQNSIAAKQDAMAQDLAAIKTVVPTREFCARAKLCLCDVPASCQPLQLHRKPPCRCCEQQRSASLTPQDTPQAAACLSPTASH